MNKPRKKRIEEVIANLDQDYQDLDSIVNEERKALDNMPESLQETEKWQQDDENCSELEDIKDEVEGLKDRLQEVVDA